MLDMFFRKATVVLLGAILALAFPANANAAPSRAVQAIEKRAVVGFPRSESLLAANNGHNFPRCGDILVLAHFWRPTGDHQAATVGLTAPTSTHSNRRLMSSNSGQRASGFVEGAVQDVFSATSTLMANLLVFRQMLQRHQQQQHFWFVALYFFVYQSAFCLPICAVS